MTTVTVSGVVAEVDGDGFPVIMIHGLGGTSNAFQPQMEPLYSYRVVRVDLPGSGRSALREMPSMATFVDAVVDLMRVLAIGRAHFVGHSLGTMVCQTIAATNPDLVQSLLLFGALAEPTEATRSGLGGRAAMARREGMAPIADQIVANALSASTRSGQPAAVAFVRESLMRQNPEGYARTCEALAKATAVDARLISAPTLLVTGDADTVNPPSVAHELAGRIAGATFATVDRAGHWLMIEKPAETNRTMVDFLKRVEH